MTEASPTPNRPAAARRTGRADRLLHHHLASVHRRTDRLFAGLLVVEWAAAVVTALWLSPTTWAGLEGRTHPHVWAAVLLGLVVISAPVGLALLCPGRALTRHVIAVGQMLMSALLIHLTGGRIETHFHVFGSLAFLAFYRDWRVLVTASAVTAADHFFRGLFWPESVYGVLAHGGWRWLEHAGWVAFEDVFLIYACLRGVREAGAIAERQARLQEINATLDLANESSKAEIAERHQVERALRASEDRYRRLTELNPDGIFVNRDGRIAFANGAALRMLGSDGPEPVIGREALDFVDPSHHGQARDRFHRLLVLGEAVPFVDERLVRLDGRAVEVEVGATPFEDEDGRAALVIVRDLSPRKRLEEQVRQAQKMEAVGQLAGGVAHDFNNLLTIINGYTELVLAEQPASRTAAALAEVHAAGTRAADLTRQLLAFSRQTMLQPKVLDLNEVVTNLQRMLGRLIGEDVRLSTVLRRSVGRVKVDPGQLEQVILNLAVNARDAMPQGGSLTIETDEVHLDEEYARSRPGVHPGRYAVLAVTDTGRGMTDEVKAHIFEPFFTTKEVGNGTGLGLATVYGIIKQSGGHVAAYSEVGRGTSFKVFLPFTQEESPARVRGRQGPPPGGLETILLVEDEARVRGLAAEALRRGGYTVVEAGCAEEALRLHTELSGSVDLLLTDVVMPGASGRVLAEQLAAAEGGLRVLYMSGYTDDAVVRHGLLAAEVAFIQKPFAVDALLRAARHVLDGGGWPAANGAQPLTATGRAG